jgi:hypothetical protein
MSPPPTAVSNLKEVYIARFEMSSANKTASRKQIDDMHQEVTLEFPKEVRDKIAEVRGKFRRQILRECLHFHGLQVVSGETKNRLVALIEQAEVELKAIDPGLHAQVTLIQVSVDATEKGALYDAVMNAIKGQVYTVLLDRLKGLAGKDDVPMRSRKALLDLCDRMRTWNVVGDPAVEETIGTYRRMFEEGIIKPVAEEVEKAVAAAESAAAYVEL